MVRVLVVHDAALLRTALVQLLRSADGFEVSSVPSRGDGPEDHDLPSDVCVVDGDCLRGPEDAGGAWFWDRCGARLIVLGTSQRPVCCAGRSTREHWGSSTRTPPRSS